MPSWKSLACAVAASWLLASVPAPLRAAELVARGPSGCPDARELAFRIERRIGMPLPQAAPLRFDVSMEAAAAGHRARIVVTPGGHDRELVASDCEELADFVSIAVALALGSTLTPPSEDPMRSAPGTEEQRQPERPEDGPATAAGVVGAREQDDSELDASLEGSAS